MTRAEALSTAHCEVADLLARFKVENDPDAGAYLIARAVLVHLAAERGVGRAAEVAHKLGRELAAQGG